MKRLDWPSALSWGVGIAFSVVCWWVLLFFLIPLTMR